MVNIDNLKIPYQIGQKKIVGFDVSEIAFVNWNAGGTSSVSGLLKTKFNRNYNTIIIGQTN
jgi:hypothetical protein